MNFKTISIHPTVHSKNFPINMTSMHYRFKFPIELKIVDNLIKKLYQSTINIDYLSMHSHVNIKKKLTVNSSLTW